MAGPFGHVSVPYPTPEEGLDSLTHLVNALLGRAPLPIAEVLAHGWIVLGAALGEGIPVATQSFGAEVAALTPEEIAILEKHAQNHAAGLQATAIDWRALLKEVAPIILKIVLTALGA